MPTPSLTPRLLEVLRLIVDLGVKDAALRLGIAESMAPQRPEDARRRIGSGSPGG